MMREPVEGKGRALLALEVTMELLFIAGESGCNGRIAWKLLNTVDTNEKMYQTMECGDGYEVR